MKKTLIIFLFLLGSFGLYFSYSKRSDCFSPSFALANSSFELGGNTPPPEEIRSLLNQSFTFIGSGNQSYAFESEDKKSVLKLFKFHCLLGFALYDWIPLQSVRELHAKKRQQKVDRLLNGLLIASTHNRIHSGILYLHFPPTPLFDQKVRIKDKAGRLHELNLENYVFVLQKKAKPLGKVLSEHLETGDLRGAEETLTRLFTMLEEDFKQGLYDRDHNVISNTGFVGNEPIRIDFGKLTKHSVDSEKELEKIKNERILPWIQKNYPQFYRTLENHLER